MSFRFICFASFVVCCFLLTGCEPIASVDYSLRTSGGGGVMVINDKVNIEFAQLDANEPFTHFDEIRTIGPGGESSSVEFGDVTVEYEYTYDRASLRFAGHEVIIESGAEVVVNGTAFRFVDKFNNEPWQKLDLVVYPDNTVEQRNTIADSGDETEVGDGSLANGE